MRVDVTVEVSCGSAPRRDRHLEVREELGAHHLCTLDFTRDEATDLPLERLLDAPITSPSPTRAAGTPPSPGR
jgi:hypothetical protein